MLPRGAARRVCPPEEQRDRAALRRRPHRKSAPGQRFSSPRPVHQLHLPIQPAATIGERAPGELEVIGACSLVEAGLVRALAHHANGDADSAAAHLAAALTDGVPAGYCRLFLDEGQPMAELLGQVARAAAHDIRMHAEHLLTAAQRPSLGVGLATVVLARRDARPRGSAARRPGPARTQTAHGPPLALGAGRR
jgi:MalT-like TPR region